MKDLKTYKDLMTICHSRQKAFWNVYFC
jgi:hypothetical protein